MRLLSSRSMTPRTRRVCARSSIRRHACMCAVSCIPPMCPRLRLWWGVVTGTGRWAGGAWITADAALEQGREVFAVPGRITDPTACAPHRLVQEGAKLVQGVGDILEELRLPVPAGPALGMPHLEGTEAMIFARLDVTPQHVDQLALRCGLPVSAVSAAPTPVESRGVVTAWPGARYSRRDVKTMMKR